MNNQAQKKAAKKFAEFWKDKGYEKGESQKFWLSLLHDIFGVEHPESFISFEDKVFLGHTSFIDGYIADTKVLIEQKSKGKNLKAKIKQSDGTLLTPFQQAKRYVTELPVDKHPKFIVTSNFQTFLVYDMNNPRGVEPEEILLENLERDYYRLSFLVDSENIHIKRETEISIQAGEIVGLLYDAFYKEYKNPTNAESLKSLNMLCVRLVFCLYAEDAGIFGKRLMFHDYLASFEPKNMQNALIRLFKVLDTKIDERDPYLEKELAQFPYVNGGLFSDKDIEIPNFTDEIKKLLLENASAGFDWSEISPTIFGAVFESTLNPVTRRTGGMHYTSIQNIHKVINPLFLDDLTQELQEIKGFKTRIKKLKAYQDKLSKLNFLDPACGSGNFLTETYISIRKLENEVIRLLYDGQISFTTKKDSPIKVSIGQFYGIEINDFACTVGKTSLWIAEIQMLRKTEEIIHTDINFLPLKSYANIIEANALRIDWEKIISKSKLNYIIGNPPFVGTSFQTPEQKEDIRKIYVDEKGKTYKTAGKNDYVSCWYFKAAKFMQNTNVTAAFISTNSITQGEQVANIFKPIFDRFNIKINFAWRSFKWDSESKSKSSVYCVIIGFSTINKTKVLKKKSNSFKKLFFDDNNFCEVENINAYLNVAPNIFMESRNKPICHVPEIIYGNKPVDGGNLLLSDEEYHELIKSEPKAKKFIRRFCGAQEYLHNIKRWCLWLVGVSPSEIAALPKVMKRVHATKEFRLKSKKAATRKFADYPTRFIEIRQPTSDYVLIPVISSGTRKYIPIGFISSDIICGNTNQMIPSANLYHFGVLTSIVHMAWMRITCGRLGTSYSYSNDIVYNNFPWCEPTDEQKLEIEKTAKKILDARDLYSDSCLADLYNDMLMPSELKKAHEENDKAVMKAYGLKENVTESDCVAFLINKYQEMI